MPTSRAERIALGSTLVVVVLLGALMILAALRERETAATSAVPGSQVRRHQQMAQGNRVDRSREEPVQQEQQQQRNAPASATPVAPPVPAARVVPAAPPKPAAVVAPPTVRLTAARGDCWAEVRRGSDAGAVLYAGILARGEARTFRGKRFWIRFGAPEAVDASIDGRPAAIPDGTLNVIVTRRGFSVAA